MRTFLDEIAHWAADAAGPWGTRVFVLLVAIFVYALAWTALATVRGFLRAVTHPPAERNYVAVVLGSALRCAIAVGLLVWVAHAAITLFPDWLGLG
jgi:hypothetical protein